MNERLKKLDFELMNNENIGTQHLGKKGLHLNDHGTGKLAINIIRTLQSL